MKEDNDFRKLSGKVNCFHAKNDSIIPKLNLLPGSIIAFESKLQKIEEKKNSWDFDYKSYALRKGISHKAFLKGERIELVESDEFIGLKNYALRIRIQLKSIFANYIKDKITLAFLESLVLGDRTNLDKDMKSSFSKLGVIHVLAVSGLHVGLIYKMILGLLFFFRKWKYKILIEFICVLFGLGIFAFISGLSPSVCRAVIMFIIMAFAKLINRESKIYNTLAITAFLILIVNPIMLFDLGFQMSFLAVIGIVYLYPIMESLIPFENQFLKKICGLSLISISATFGTLPITLYYFKQFPSLFILSNLLIIPLAVLVLNLGITLLIFNKVEIIAKVIAQMIDFVSQFILLISEYLSELPFALIENIGFDQYQFTLLAILSLGLIILIENRNKWSYSVFFGLLIVFSSYNFYIQFHESTKSKLLVFSSNEMGILEGNTLRLFESLKGSIGENRLNSIRKYFRIDRIINETIISSEQDQSWRVKIGDIEFIKPLAKPVEEANIDWVICDNSNFKHILNSSYNPSKGFILDDNISFFKRRKLNVQLTTKGYFVYDLSESGALELELENGN